MADPTLGDYLQEKVTAAIVDALTQLKDELTKIAEAGGDHAAGGTLGTIDRITGVIGNVLGALAGGATMFEDVLGVAGGPLEQVMADATGSALSFGHGYLIGYFLWNLLSPAFAPLTQGVNQLTQFQILDPQTLAQLAAKRLIPDAHAETEGEKSGLSDNTTHTLIEAAYQYPQLTDLLALLNRGMIQREDVVTALERSGAPGAYIDALISLQDQVLSPPDIALAALRGDITEDEAKAMAIQVGVNESLLGLLMGNTGEPPGAMQMLEMYRRGFIDETRLERGIKQSRMRDEWIPYFRKLRYEPMSVADAVDAAVQNHLTQDEAKQIAELDGLDPQYFHTLYETAGEPISRVEALELMHRGLMTQAEVEQAIRESHIKDKYIPYILELGRKLIPYRTINTIVNHGVRPVEWGVQYLVSLGYTHDDATALMGTSTSTKVAQTKHLTETMALDLYEAKAITEQEAIGLLGNIGYNTQEATYLLHVQDAQATLKEQNTAISRIRTAYVDGKITLTDASNDLDNVGVLATHRDKLLKEWQVEKRTAVRVLTPAQVADAVKYQLWTFDEAHSKLVDMGYSKDDATIFLGVELHGLPAGMQAPKPRSTG